MSVIKNQVRCIGLICFCLCIIQQLSAQVRLPRLIRDSMILQRDTRLKIWGWAAAGENVTVTFNKKKYKTKTGSDGKWRVTLQPTKAGGPHTMNIDASNHLTLTNILMGDVWLCAGQSNMVHQMSLHNVLYEADIAKANYPEIRHFFVPNVTNLQAPQQDLPGGFWKWANPKDVNEFSAVAYFFARKLYEKYHVPIGLINASWGGTPIEAWMSEAGFHKFPTIMERIIKNKDTAYISSLRRQPNLSTPRPQDRGMSEKWFEPNYDPKGWRPIAIPGYWEDQGI